MSITTEPVQQIALDQRDEAQLLSAAQARVWEASGRTINDFSPSSPITALLEGQVFAQAELAYWINKLPDALTIAFLKRLGLEQIVGVQAQAMLTFKLTSTLASPFSLPKGYSIFTNSGLEWQTNSLAIVQPGNLYGQVLATCLTPGTLGNVPPGSITKLSIPLSYLLSATNAKAYGGLDAESNKDFYSRTFSALSVHAPITANDFEILLKGVLGQSALVKVTGSFGQVICQVLDATGSAIVDSQAQSLSTWLESIAPIGTIVRVQNFLVVDIDATLDIGYKDYQSKSTTELNALTAQAVKQALLPGTLHQLVTRQIEWQLMSLPWISSAKLSLSSELGFSDCTNQINLGDATCKGKSLVIMNQGDITTYDLAS